MKQFLKENTAIAAAIILPAALALIFFLSTMLTKVSVEDPKHDFVIATNYYDYNTETLRIGVVNDRLEVNYRVPKKDESYNNRDTRLWLVRVKDMSVEELGLSLPADGTPGNNQLIDIPALKDVTMTSRQPGPDGYRLEQASYYNGGLMMEIFAADHNRGGAALVKNGRVIEIKGLPDNYYNPTFIGWIVENK